MIKGCSKKSFQSIRVFTCCFRSKERRFMQHYEIWSFTSSGKRILPSSIAFLSYSLFSAKKGGNPTINSNMITPTDHKSAFSVYFSCLYNSGAIYMGVPHVVSNRSSPYSYYLARPKSTNFKVAFSDLSVSIIF